MKWLLRFFGLLAIFIGALLLIGMVSNAFKPKQIAHPIDLIGVIIVLFPLVLGIYLLRSANPGDKQSSPEQAPGIPIWLKAWQYFSGVQWKEALVLENWKRYFWQTIAGIVCDGKPLPPFMLPIFLFYFMGAGALQFIDYFLLEEFPVANDFTIFHLSFYVALFLAVVFFTLVYVKEDGLDLVESKV